MDAPTAPTAPKKLGILIGGTGLIGGTLTHYFKTTAENEFDILAPNSKRLSLRDANDIRRYFSRYRPDFIINAAIAALDSDPLLAFETNTMGSVLLARAALEMGIPYIHCSTAAVLPSGENLREENLLPLTPRLANYPKSKLMAELALRELAERRGLDYTCIRLGIVYGEHDHKIQGFQRLLFSVADRAMVALFTSRGALHSYSNAKKLPHFVHHVLTHRAEFSGQTYHFVDPSPVSLSQLILTIKAYLELATPREIYLPYPLARFGRDCMHRLLRLLTRIGIEARMPAELMFLKNFYQTQTLAADKLLRSSFLDPYPAATVFTELPSLIQYYLTRWEQLNLIAPLAGEFFDPRKPTDLFVSAPDRLLDRIKAEAATSFLEPR
ncbi:MAG TPA: NAD-dependent epimerase/dehydratase family protein [Desulfurivibrionaceae bacterium]|nr:NAD-dependent epimerase/dehydratase family protein [Desulfurivibrionaceae bacterium]